MICPYAQHSQTISMIIENVSSSLFNIETVLQSFTEKLVDVKNDTDIILPN